MFPRHNRRATPGLLLCESRANLSSNTPCATLAKPIGFSTYRHPPVAGTLLGNALTFFAFRKLLLLGIKFGEHSALRRFADVWRVRLADAAVRLVLSL
jgi:hypothetical protein